MPSTSSNSIRKPRSLPLGKSLCFVTGFVLGGLSVGAIAHEIITIGYSYGEMDWNDNGWTTLGEMLDSVNVGVEQVEVKGRACHYFFAYKDARMIKTVCDGKSIDFDPYGPQYPQ